MIDGLWFSCGCTPREQGKKKKRGKPSSDNCIQADNQFRQPLRPQREAKPSRTTGSYMMLNVLRYHIQPSRRLLPVPRSISTECRPQNSRSLLTSLALLNIHICGLGGRWIRQGRRECHLCI